MVTVREYLMKYMVDRGLFKEHAEQVLAHYPNPEVFSRDTTSCNQHEFMKIYTTIDRCVLRWMDETMPLHFARPMF